MAELPCVWLSADHTFKVSANIGVWKEGVWLKQFDSLFTVLNEKGQILGWRLTRGTAFNEVKDMLQLLKNRLDRRNIKPKRICIDNCCQWRHSLQSIFGYDVEINLDLFHATQRVVSKIPKKGKRGSPIKDVRRRLTEDIKSIFRDPSDIASVRSKDTPSIQVLTQNLENFVKKWKDVTCDGERVLTEGAIQELDKLKKHINNGCLSNIPVSCGSNRNEALHKSLNRNISRQRLGVRLALALFGIFFYIWNEKREQYFLNDSVVKHVREYSFLASDITRTLLAQSFGIGPSERSQMVKMNSSVEESLPGNFSASAVVDEEGSSSDECLTDKEDSVIKTEAFDAVKNAQLKLCLASKLASMAKTGLLPAIRTLNMTKSVLLLLSNSFFSKSCDEINAERRGDGLLSGYGLQRVFMPKDGNCLFSSIAFALQNQLNVPENNLNSSFLEHLESVGVTKDLNMLCMIRTLRKLTVDEFLGEHRSEYASYLEVDENQDYDQMAESLKKNGFFYCALGNAVPLALSNILKVPLVIMSSLEHYPVIPILPREIPLSRTPLYIVHLRIGAGHYDAAIDNPLLPRETGESSCSSSTSKLPSSCQNEATSKEPIILEVGCRCGRGSARNKEERSFCRVYKDGCKCFQAVRGCTDKCSCYNCGNPHRKKEVVKTGTLEPVPRKRRRHAAPSVSSMKDENFMETRERNVKPSSWTDFEELLLKECVFYLNSVDKLNDISLVEMYNNAVNISQGGESIQRHFSQQLPFANRRGLEDVQRMINRLQKQNDAFNVLFKNQISMNFKKST